MLLFLLPDGDFSVFNVTGETTSILRLNGTVFQGIHSLTRTYNQVSTIEYALEVAATFVSNNG